MIDYRHIYSTRRFMGRNQDFIEHLILGVCLILGLSVVMGWV